MSDQQLKHRIIEALWSVVDANPDILSATLTGSFVNSATLDGLSDIDFVVILERLNQQRFAELKRDFQRAVEPVLQEAGYAFQLNPTLGPLKFNAPKLAVLHLMLYTHEGHVSHVINSPFTCLDWQQSNCYRKQSMAEVYPTFGLQPRHFLSARRSISDYLNDFRASVVSYRELVCNANGYEEKKRTKAMDTRDRHEFAYHVMRFLMLNLLKLVRRYDPSCQQLDNLMEQFFGVFPAGQQDAERLLGQLAVKKRQVDYATALEGLDARLEEFVANFEQQFRRVFIDDATRHIAFRHAATELNVGPVRFLGRSNPAILTDSDAQLWKKLRSEIADLAPRQAYTSPLLRCKQSLLNVAAELPTSEDERLLEIDYGACEAMTVQDCQRVYPDLFEAWGRGLDPNFPGGESSAEVTRRAMDFAQQGWIDTNQSSVVCTHNVVLRSVVGEALQVPPGERHRIRIPHLAPIQIVATKDFGIFVNLDASTERIMFEDFAPAPAEDVQHKAAA